VAEPTPTPKPDADTVTNLLALVSTGDDAAASRLFGLLYGELRERARGILRNQNATLQPTALVHEAWLRLVPGKQQPLNDRGHFLRLAAKAMRSVLVDHVRARGADKRGGSRNRVAFDEVCSLYEDRAVDLLTLDEALTKLHVLDDQLLQIVELRFFAGLELDAIAEVLGVSRSTVDRGWRTARTWLRATLGEP
jgi:RNA polymerase sigma factor (TIGR02999 family)